MKSNQHPTPPLLADCFLKWFLTPHLLEIVLGDLHEEFYYNVGKFGAQKASRLYWWEVLGFFKPAYIRRTWSTTQKTPHALDPMPPAFFYESTPILTFDMIRNYFKIAFRNLAKSKVYSLINIIGLAVGMACAMLVFMVVRHETGYDQDLPNGEQIYRVETENIKENHTYPGTYTGMANALRTDFNDAEVIAPLLKINGSTFSVPSLDKRFRESFVFADQGLFKLLNYQWLAGSPEKALAEPNTVVLSRSYALKYFGTTDIIGKIVRLDNKQNLAVTGVLEDHNVKSSFPFEMLVSFSTKAIVDPDFDLNKWNGWNDNFQIFVLLKSGVKKSDIAKRFSSIVYKYMGKEALSVKKFKLNPLARLHYSGNLGGRTANLSLLKTLSLIGVMVLMIGCFNFINLSTAQAFKRAREVGIRKAIGSNRSSLIYQFLTEAAVITFLAVLVAFMITSLTMQSVAGTMDIPLTASDLFNWEAGAFAVVLVFLTTLCAGLYPAFRLSGMEPIWTLKSKVFNRSTPWFSVRQGLVVVQFTVSLILISSAWLINRQLSFFRNSDLGFNKSGIITVGVPDNKPEKLLALRNQLASLSQIRDISFSFNSASAESNWMQGMEYRKGPKPIEIKTQMKMGDSHYLNTYGIQLLAGENLRDTDTSDFKVLANEVFLNRAGIGSPADAIGQRIYYGDGHEFATIIGVVKNFNVNSLHQKIDPTLIQVIPNNFYQAGIKLENGNASAESLHAVLADIEKAWISIFPNQVFDYTFLDDALAQAYKSEMRMSRMIEASTLLAVLIACLGLFGLATFTAEQRTKEIGVRKVLGASIASIVTLLSKDFLKLILLAVLIASPIAWYAMNEWLQNFEFKIEIRWWMFAFTGLLMSGIALLTVSFQSIKAALVNPVRSLRSE